MKLEITGSAGTCTLEKTMAKEIRFAAGSYNTATISYIKPEKVLFAESFGTKAIGTDNIPKYDKSGLTTFYPEDKTIIVMDRVIMLQFRLSHTLLKQRQVLM